jgi:hypothetical protein
MAKWYGKIGYAETVETAPGVWKEQFTEREYYGDVIRNARNLQNSGQVNDNIDIANEFSILADPFAYQNFHSMRYIEFMGALWKITKVDVQYPRLTLTVGGVYNGKQA